MRINKLSVLLLVAIAVCSIFYGCKKQEVGFLSDNLYYLENPFTVQQGITITSSSMVADGSTLPLQTTLLAIRNKITGKRVDSMFLKPQTITVYKGTVTYKDTTEALLRSKLKDSVVAPFSINSLGGRLQFTQSTKYVDPGIYTIDINATNVRGAKLLNDICDIVVTPITSIDTILFKSWTTSDVNGNFYSIPQPLNVVITHNEAGPEKIVFKFLDKNGTPFSPANGEVVPRTGRPSFKNWNPFYTPVATDTSLEFKYLAGIPKIPAYSNTVIADGSSWTDGITYYQVPAKYTDINLNVNSVLTAQFFVTKGTYIITYYLSNVVRK